jgi:hypothetical protein
LTFAITVREAKLQVSLSRATAPDRLVLWQRASNRLLDGGEHAVHADNLELRTQEDREQLVVASSSTSTHILVGSLVVTVIALILWKVHLC